MRLLEIPKMHPADFMIEVINAVKAAPQINMSQLIELGFFNGRYIKSCSVGGAVFMHLDKDLMHDSRYGFDVIPCDPETMDEHRKYTIMHYLEGIFDKMNSGPAYLSSVIYSIHQLWHTEFEIFTPSLNADMKKNLPRFSGKLGWYSRYKLVKYLWRWEAALREHVKPR